MSYRDWEIRNFDLGVIDKVDAPLLPEGAAKDSRNFFSKTVGVLETRKGQRRAVTSLPMFGPIQGLHSYYFGDFLTERQLILAAAGQAGYWNGTVYTPIKTGLSETQPLLFESCVNYMVAFNGVDLPWKWNGASVSNLLNAPADGRFPVLHKEKLFVVPVTDPSMLQWSESFKPEDWPAVNYWMIKDGDGDEITCLTKHMGELLIFKRRSIHSLRGTDLSSFRLDELDSRVGCVGPRAAVAHKTHVYFVGDKGLYLFNGMSATNLSEGRIPKLWSTVNLQHVHKAAVTVWAGLVWVAVPTGTGTYNNTVIVYNPETQAFWPMGGINASCFETYNTGSAVLLYSGDAVGAHVNEQEYGNDDFGGGITSYWQGKAFDLGKPEYLKKSRRAFVEHSPYAPAVPDLSVSLNGGEFNNLHHDHGDGMIEQYRFSPRERWRYLSPRLDYEGKEACQVRSIMLPFKAKWKPKVRAVTASE